jgi:hypothetical protein
MRALCNPGTTPDTTRLGEFFAGPKNSHGASNVTGPSSERRRPEFVRSTTAALGE